MTNDWTPSDYALMENFDVPVEAIRRLHLGRPTRGIFSIVDRIPQCDFCEDQGKVDFKTLHGPWAHGCNTHWRKHRMYDSLGTGKAQVWVVIHAG